MNRKGVYEFSIPGSLEDECTVFASNVRIVMSCNKQHIEEESPAGFPNIFIFDGMEWKNVPCIKV